jgi:hypothetical protein
MIPDRPWGRAEKPARKREQAFELMLSLHP